MCSGSVVEDIDMAEMASVASGPTSTALTSSLERFNSRDSTVPQHKGVEFASNILNDMGPPAQLCSALLLAANAACRPSSRCSFRSFDTNNDGEAPSDVGAHVDTVGYFICYFQFSFTLYYATKLIGSHSRMIAAIALSSRVKRAHFIVKRTQLPYTKKGTLVNLR